MRRIAAVLILASIPSLLPAESIDQVRQNQLREQVEAIRNEQSNHRSASWKVSAIVLVGALAADAATSWGKREINPLVPTANGQFGGRSLGLKAGVAGGSLVAQHFLLKKSPQAERAMTFANFGMAGLLTSAAVSNSRVSK
jgi:hypothetical protein